MKATLRILLFTIKICLLQPDRATALPVSSHIKKASTSVTMDLSNINTKSFIFGGVVVGLIAATAFSMYHTRCCKKYSTPDQPLRFATAKANKNKRMLNIQSVYAPEYVRGKVVVVTGKAFLLLQV